MLGVRHETDDVAALVAQARDVTQRAVGVDVEIPEGDEALALEAVERGLVGDEPAFAVLQRDRDLLASREAAGPRARRRLDAQALVAADEIAVVVADQAARQEVGFDEDLEAVADAQHRHAAVRRIDDLGHDRRTGRDRTAPQVVAVAEAAGQHDRVDAHEVVRAVPQRQRLAAGEADRAHRITVVERTRKIDDADAH